MARHVSWYEMGANLQPTRLSFDNKTAEYYFQRRDVRRSTGLVVWITYLTVPHRTLLKLSRTDIEAILRDPYGDWLVTGP